MTVRTVATTHRGTRACVECGQQFKPKRHDSLCCGKACIQAARTRGQRIMVSQLAACPTCGTRHRTTTCPACDRRRKQAARQGELERLREERDARRQADREQQRRLLAERLAARRCDHCGTSYEPRTTIQRYCSASCLKKASRQHERYAKRCLPGVRIESVNRIEVMERSRWTCGICGQAIDRALPPHDRMSATIDHVTPLAAGGDHSADNCQAAHRICNALKG